jgi:hypothetical protein
VGTDQTAVGWNDGPTLQDDQVARDQRLRRYVHLGAIAQGACGHRRRRSEAPDGALGASLRGEADDGVERHDRHDGPGLEHGAGRE